MNIPKILELRNRVSDPSGFLRIVEVQQLPPEGDEQTAYRLPSGKYVNKDGELVHMMLADELIDAWIRELGLDLAECRAYDGLATRLNGEITKLTTGTETTEYARLMDRYRYYRSLSDDCKARHSAKTGGDTGGFYKTGSRPIIAGGQI